MPELRDRWGAYARLQQTLERRRRVDDRTWGLEAGLNRLLSAEPPAEEDVDRAILSESRKERYRTELRRTYPSDDPSKGTLQHTLDTRQRFRRIQARVTAMEWAILRAVAEGYTYKEIASFAKVSPGALRVRVLRLRRTLAA